MFCISLVRSKRSAFSSEEAECLIHRCRKNRVPDQIREASLGANVVPQDDDATLTGLDADHRVGGLASYPPL